MIYIRTFFYYVCFASSVLIYGIGINKTAEINSLHDKDIIYFLKIILTIFITFAAKIFCLNNYFSIHLQKI